MQVVGVGKFFGDEGKWHAHIFEAIEWSFEVKTFYVRRLVLRALCTNHAVPQQFCGGEVGRACCELPRVFNEVAPDGDADAVGIVLLGSRIDDNARICDLHSLGIALISW